MRRGESHGRSRLRRARGVAGDGEGEGEGRLGGLSTVWIGSTPGKIATGMEAPETSSFHAWAAGPSRKWLSLATFGLRSLRFVVLIGPLGIQGPLVDVRLLEFGCRSGPRMRRMGSGRGSVKGSILSSRKCILKTFMSGKKPFLVPSLEF